MVSLILLAKFTCLQPSDASWFISLQAFMLKILFYSSLNRNRKIVPCRASSSHLYHNMPGYDSEITHTQTHFLFAWPLAHTLPTLLAGVHHCAICFFNSMVPSIHHTSDFSAVITPAACHSICVVQQERSI